MSHCAARHGPRLLYPSTTALTARATPVEGPLIISSVPDALTSAIQRVRTTTFIHDFHLLLLMVNSFTVSRVSFLLSSYTHSLPCLDFSSSSGRYGAENRFWSLIFGTYYLSQTALSLGKLFPCDHLCDECIIACGAHYCNDTVREISSTKYDGPNHVSMRGTRLNLEGIQFSLCAALRC